MDDAALITAPRQARSEGPRQRLTEVLRIAGRHRGLTASEFFEDRGDGLAALLRAHSNPNGSDSAGEIPARPLLEAVAGAFSAAPHRIAVDCDPKLRLPQDELVALGVIVHEAVGNALKHAFPAGRDGQVWVRLVDDRGRWRLTIRDNGLGISDLPSAPLGGAGLIEALAENQGGYARLGSAPFGGGLVSVIFPKNAG